MSHNRVQTITVLPYGDPLSLILLWQKAFMLVPLWAIPVVPLIGLTARYTGTLAMESAYAGLICLFGIYFFEDLLKRKIRIDQRNIFFGFRAFPIKDIVSLELPNKRNKLLPNCLALTSTTGRQLKLKLDGLSDRSLEALIGHIESCNSQVKISPVLSVLLKSRRRVQLPLVIPTRLELSYNSKPVVRESVAVFRATAAKWMRVGPLITLTLVTGCWLNWLSSLYCMLMPSYDMQNQFFLQTFLWQCNSAMGHLLYSAGNTATTTISKAVGNPWAMGVLSVLFAAIAFYFYRVLWKPNKLIADNAGLSLALRLGFLTVPFAAVKWAEVEGLELQEGSNNASKIKIERTGAKAINLDLSSINVSERGLLLKHIESAVPGCPIGHQVAQSLMARSDHSYTELWLQSLIQTPERKTLDPLEPGQLLADGRFEVLHSLGVGGQGTAYLCHENQKGGYTRTVVLKETILPVFGDSLVRQKALQGFEQEAKLLQGLSHPGIVRLVDYFIEDHRAYLVLEHVSGSNLRQLVLNQGPIDEERLQVLVAQMCEILTYLHAQGVVHRDFTPDNLLLDAGGKIKLIDFNVAQQIQGGSQGSIVGKPAYMPPEQFRGKANSQSDIYSFGATIFFLLTGLDPEPLLPSSPSSKVSSVSKTMDTIVKKATSLQLNSRYKSAQEILADTGAVSCTLGQEPNLAEVHQHG